LPEVSMKHFLTSLLLGSLLVGGLAASHVAFS
jgi:hypothetical protein